RVEAIEVELTVLLRPWTAEAAGFRGQGVVPDLERAGDLPVGPREGSRQVEAVPPELVQAWGEIEIEVEHGAIVLAGGDERGGLAPEHEVMRILGMECQRSLR